MIQSAFLALGLTGKSCTSSIWFMDSGASNHITASSANLANLKQYKGDLQVQIADGKNLHIMGFGDIPHPLPLKHVFLSLSLSTYLLSTGQLVDNNCMVSFSSSGCAMQDQVSGKVI